MNHYEIKIPKLASLINTHSFDGVLPGLDIADDDKILQLQQYSSHLELW